ncbi:MAG: TonB-dependent receptor plug domain-containing protein, partial [Novosphingobium sp.]|nr:TonB-dependent receptor plug domain-containing protein [Novosphingobium sp.]
MNRVLLKSALVATTALGLAAPAMAAEDDDDGIIIVNARRVAENQQDVSISMTVVQQEELTKRNIVSAAELGAFVPSLSSNEQFGPGKASFVIRGFTQEGKTSPSVAVYFADVVAPRSFGGTTSGNGAGIGSMFDLEQVEVLKGPQGTLFGRNTTGGAILLRPTKPKDVIEGYVQGSIGNHNMRRAELVLNAPLTDRIRVRGSLDWHERDGYVRNRSGVGPKDFNDIGYIAARFSVVVDLAENLENYTIASYSRSNTNGNVNKLAACTDANGNPPDFATLTVAAALNPLGCAQIARQQARGDGFWDVENDEAQAGQEIIQWQVINTTTWEASDNLTIKNIVSYAEYKESVTFDLFGTNYLSPGTNTLVTKTINLHGGFDRWQSQQSTFTEELQFIGEAAGGRLNWQAGAYLEVSKPLGWNSGNTEIFTTCPDNTNYLTGAGFGGCQPYQLFGFIPIGSLSSSNVKTTFNNKGIYGQAS